MPANYWGKAHPPSGSAAEFHVLEYHCLDVAAVGVEYLRRAPRLVAFLAAQLDLGRPDLLESWLALWLALHDLGKFSEAFQSQKPELFQALRGRAPEAAKPYRIRHDSLGFLYWSKSLSIQLEEQQWLGPESACFQYGLDCWAQAVTGHHGRPPEEKEEYLGHHFCKEDHGAIAEFVTQVRELFLSAPLVREVQRWDPESFFETSQQLSWWIAGLTVLADWIGSNTDYFPYRTEEIPLAEYWEIARNQAVKALDKTGVTPVSAESGLRFADVFASIENPSPLQHWAIEAAPGSGPQIHLLEDVTGSGKTEAAMMLAYRLMDAGVADGFYIGLPTMATANAMYERIAGFYRRLFRDDASLVLAHGQRHLVESFAATVLPGSAEEHDPDQIDETASARCSAWLADHNKRALLASAGVGTIDQALSAVLHSRHQSLRLLGLFGKVLIIDEVHACDAYMQRVLETLLQFHAYAGGSVILLSATLPTRMRQSLLSAFASGRRLTAPQCRAEAYPLTTAWRATQPDQLLEQALATRAAVRRQVDVVLIDRQAEIVQGIVSAVSEGRCVCWIRNTIHDALDAQAALEGLIAPEKITLFHARFALEDRLRIEQKILNHFGKDSRATEREGRLVIATQVVEQSLDADWDLMVSDLAPIDRIVQRAGRLCRHLRDAQGNPLKSGVDQRGTPKLLVFTPKWADEPDAQWFKAAFPKAAAVYPHHAQLWRTMKVLRKGRLAMPDDARPFIEEVYANDEEMPEGLKKVTQDVEADGYANISIAQQNSLRLDAGYERGGIDWWSEAQTPSRLGEPSSSVILARWDKGKLKPWAQGDYSLRHAWAYSCLRVAERLIAETAQDADVEKDKAILAALETMPNKGRWSVLLPLKETAEGFVGKAFNKPSCGEPKLTRWRYDPKLGLTTFTNDGANLKDSE
ncbi:MAG: CRISPR-associated helicase Cas3' [Panacagrimonas sp.]